MGVKTENPSTSAKFPKLRKNGHILAIFATQAKISPVNLTKN
jgi:hypothetical protein